MQGCALAVVDDPGLASLEKTFLVEDVLNSLQKLANLHRKQFSIPVIGITGSNGKTTSKELINAVLSKKYQTLCTEGNLNNHIGVPLTLLRLNPKHEIAIIEMGANHQGEIDLLSRIAEPDFGIITNIGKAHLEGFGGIDGVKKGKSELYRFIKEKNGKIFLHGDDEILSDLAKDNDKITYGTKKLYDVVGKYEEGTFVRFAWKTRYTAQELKSAKFHDSHLVGIYNYHNLLCAACVGNYFKVDEALINEALENYQPSNNRSQLVNSGKNKLIADYYNANPTSMQLALENFAKMEGDKVVILGDMLELGDESIAEHNKILNLLNDLGLKTYYLVGPIFQSIDHTHSFTTSDELAAKLSDSQLKDKLILIKGSRGIKLERVIPKL